MSDKAADPKNDKMSIELLQYNNLNIDKFQTVVFIAGGIISGVLGFTGLMGLLMFVLLSAIASLALILKCNFNLSKYTNSGMFGLSMNGITNFAMSFILFWTLTYALVHIY
mmetsp:Transcript_16205/g.27392  ORF Transcript_16205/g.27392 Transcript_16205/m.27392 type:complete len:111 (-) Transcript_16205:1031-1363(-)